MGPGKRKSLGRGLDALLGPAGLGPADEVGTSAEDSTLRNLPVEFLQRGRYQPRSEFDPAALQELADSIQAQGVVQPIVVRPLSTDRYEIIAGERRWRAAQLAGLAEIPALVRDIPDEVALAIALIENIQREDLNPLEEAVAFKRLVDEFGMTHQEVADAVGRSRAAITNLLRLLDLNPEVKRYVEQGALDMGHARALAGLSGPRQTEAANIVVDKALSVRATEALVRRMLQEADQPKRAKPESDPNIRRLQDDLSERLGAPVKIQQEGRGKGRLVIQYGSLDELDGILERIR